MFTACGSRRLRQPHQVVGAPQAAMSKRSARFGILRCGQGFMSRSTSTAALSDDARLK